jgi:transporter family-2 protein
MSFSVGLICCFIFFGVDVGALHTPLPTDALKSKNMFFVYKYQIF